MRVNENEQKQQSSLVEKLNVCTVYNSAQHSYINSSHIPLMYAVCDEHDVALTTEESELTATKYKQNVYTTFDTHTQYSFKF